MTDAVVVGAGVIGLTTAICLAERGLRVHIRTAEPPERTTSAVAGAFIGPGAHYMPDPVQSGWEAAAETDFEALITDPASGVRRSAGMFGARSAASIPVDASVMRQARATDPPVGMNYAVRVQGIVVDMRRYLSYLVDRFAAAGGRIHVDPLTSLREAGAPVVVNCTGLAARTLAADPQVYPVWGQHVVVANPGLDEFFIEWDGGDAFACWFPHGDRVVVGGVAVRDDRPLAPDPATAAAIVARCASIEPRLATAPILYHLVGRRPCRPGIRVEREDAGGLTVVHNYGHGGMGVTLSWGTARAAAALVA
jgi:D-amino-acid oxidase